MHGSRTVAGCEQVPVGRDYRVSAAAVARAMTRNTVLVVASSPCFPHGVIDDVVGIAEVRASKPQIFAMGHAPSQNTMQCRDNFDSASRASDSFLSLIPAQPSRKLKELHGAVFHDLANIPGARTLQ